MAGLQEKDMTPLMRASIKYGIAKHKMPSTVSFCYKCGGETSFDDMIGNNCQEKSCTTEDRFYTGTVSVAVEFADLWRRGRAKGKKSAELQLIVLRAMLKALKLPKKELELELALQKGGKASVSPHLSLGENVKTAPGRERQKGES